MAGPPSRGGWFRRPHAAGGARTLAGQVFVLQVAVVVLLVAVALVALLLQSRYDGRQEAEHRATAVAETFANAPGVVQAVRGPDPTAVLQPRAEAARRKSDVDFVVVMTPHGIRYTHPNTSLIGKSFMGHIEEAARADRHRDLHRHARLVRACRGAVRDDRGRVVALVAAGITINRVSGVVDRQLPLLLTGAAAALLLATGGTALVTGRLRRQTHGLDPAEMTRMYEHHDAVLHAVREGVLIVGGDGRLVLANDEARRLFDLPQDAEGGTSPTSVSTRVRPRCSPPAGPPPTRCTPRGPAAGRQPPAHRPRRRPAGIRRDPAGHHRAADADRQGRRGAQAAAAAVRRGRPHRHHPGRGAHRAGAGRVRGRALRRPRHRRPGRSGAARGRAERDGPAAPHRGRRVSRTRRCTRSAS
ncbi:hypothetical protein NKH77_27985 [Streptomyces sp. M19]